MKDQVTSLEQSQRLLELGVPAEKASMCWADPGDGWRVIVKVPGPYVVPAFTVADLLELIPKEITGKKYSDRIYELSICGAGYSSDMWFFGYQNCNNGDCIGKQTSISLMELLNDRIEWLLSNDYKLNL